ncbi:MAG TPA: uroporphyrinogen decarboxylase family protein, partial [Armatimonadota bacterium]
PTTLQTDFSHYFTRDGVRWEEWGRGRLWDASMHYAEYLYPLERAETVDDLLAYPWPDHDAPYRFTGLADRVTALHARGLGVQGALAETLFEIAWQLRSMDRLFEDILTESAMATVLLDKIIERKVAMARAYARAGVDILHTGDDIAMQSGLMMSRTMFNDWFRPRLERVITAAREEKPDILIWFHSDGKIDDMIPDLIDAGVDILNPVQPECVDHRWVKATYGDRLAFSGGLGVQSILPFGTPDEVREHVRETIDALGAGGGLLLGPSHILERDTPIENVAAMLEAMDRFC